MTVSTEVQKMLVVGGVLALGTAVIRWSPITIAPMGALMIGWSMKQLGRQVGKVGKVFVSGAAA